MRQWGFRGGAETIKSSQSAWEVRVTNFSLILIKWAMKQTLFKKLAKLHICQRWKEVWTCYSFHGSEQGINIYSQADFLKRKDVNEWCKVIITITGKRRTDYEPFSFSEKRNYHTHTQTLAHTEYIFHLTKDRKISQNPHKIRDQNRIKDTIPYGISLHIKGKKPWI